MKQPLISESLKIIRLYWGKSQSEMANLLGISQPYVSEIEKGKKEVTLELLGKYSNALNVPMSSLLLFAEGVDGVPAKSKGKLVLAEATVGILKRLVSHAAGEDRSL